MDIAFRIVVREVFGGEGASDSSADYGDGFALVVVVFVIGGGVWGCRCSKWRKVDK